MSRIIFVSGVSGSGKSTVMKALLEHDDRLVYVPSVSTRPMREGESQDNPYHFVSVEQFVQMREGGQLLEWNQYGEHWYGSDKDELLRIVAEGKYPIKEIDLNGLALIANEERLTTDQYTTLFMDIDDVEMTARILGRQPDINADELQMRLQTAADERAVAAQYGQYMIDASPAVEEVIAAVRAVVDEIVL